MFDPDAFVDLELLAQSVSADAFHLSRNRDGPPLDDGETDLPDAGKREGNEPRRYRQLSKECIRKGLVAIGEDVKALRIGNCCTKIYKHIHENGVRFTAHECGVSCCPDRERRDARKHSRVVARQVERLMAKHPGSQCIMLTVPLGRTIPAHEVRDGVGQLMRDFPKLMMRAPVKRAVIGWVRKVELARNPLSWLWNIHAHSLLVVPADYFKRKSELFLHQEKWAELWRKTRKLDYMPVVDVRVLHGVKAPLDEVGRKSLREVVKYDTKPSSLVVSRKGRPVLVGATHEELYDIGDGLGLQPHFNVPLRAVLDATKNRRMLSMSRNLQGEDIEDLEFGEYPEDHEPNKESADLGRFICTEVYVWRVRGYDADFFLVKRLFDEPTGRYAMPP
jgi:plasmid rolling circle replication initiator protein Rep